MDETIGVKGGRNDKRRSLIISKKKKEKLKKYDEEKELKELEKEVKKKQIYTLIKALPIAIGGGSFKILYDNATNHKDIDKEEEYSKWRIKEYDSDFTTKTKDEKVKTKQIVVIQTDGRKVLVNVPIEEKYIEKDKKTDNNDQNKNVDKDNITTSDKPIIIKEDKVKEVIQDNIKMPKTSVGVDLSLEEKKEEKESIQYDSQIDFNLLNEDQKEKLYKLQTRKIIDEYEKQLKDIRYELRQLVVDYNVLVDNEKDIVTSREAEEILDRLSDVIYKVERLKEKIRIDNLDKYDDNYIYTLIEDYLLEFKDKRVVDEIKESPLYILISEKLEELDTKKDDLLEKVGSKKEDLEEKEEDFDKLKDKYYKVDKINKELLVFQNEQDMLLKEIKEKVRNSVSVSEKVEVQMEAMSKQSRRLLRMLTLSMLFPGPRAAKGASAATALYLNFARQLLRPKTTTKKYKVISVRDYSRDIEYSINSISNAIDLLGKTDKQIDKLIRQIKDEFEDYIGVLPECDELLSNLEKVKRDIHEKEYEMERIKKEQEKQLELNDQKVLKRGEYQM